MEAVAELDGRVGKLEHLRLRCVEVRAWWYLAAASLDPGGREMPLDRV